MQSTPIQPRITVVAKLIAIGASVLLSIPGLTALQSGHYHAVINKYGRHVIDAYGSKAITMAIGNIALALIPLALLMPNKYWAVLWALICFAAGFSLLLFV